MGRRQQRRPDKQHKDRLWETMPMSAHCVDSFHDSPGESLFHFRKKFSDNPIEPFPGRYLVIVPNTLGPQVMLYWTYNAFRHITVT